MQFAKLSFLAVLYMLLLAFVSYRIFAFAFFSDTGTSTANVFAAATQFPTPTPPIAQTLVINELLPTSHCDLGGGKSAAWIELWNGTGGDVDLKNFKLNDGNVTVDIVNSQTILHTHSFALLAKDNSIWTQCYTAAEGALTVNLGSNSPINLDTGIMRLINTDGKTILDRVEFGASNSGVLQTIPDQSIERIQLGFDSALGDAFNASDFSKQCPSTPGTWNTPTGECSVVINELMWMGSSADTDDEWIELRNTTGSPINLASWKIVGVGSGANASFTIASGTIPANGTFLLSHFASGSSSLNVTPDIVDTSIQLDNTDAQYVLKNSVGNIVDTADDGSSSPLAGSNGTPKASMERNNTPGDGTVAGSWHTATTTVNFDGGVIDKGTPKATND